MTPAERQRRHRGHTALCKYCGRPGERLNGIGYVDEGKEPKQFYVCLSCLIAALALYKKSRNADFAHHERMAESNRRMPAC
jgi:hypothetical protein